MNTAITLRDFFGLKEINLSQQQLAGIERQQATQVVFSAVTKFSTLSPQDLCAGIADAMGQTLDISLPEFLAATWCKARELRKYTDKTKYKPNDVNYVELVKHTLSSEHQPEVELLINHSSVGKVKFDVTFEIEIDGAKLKIQDGKIKQLRAVTCKGVCKIEYGDYELLKKASRDLELPGMVDLGEGIAIPAAA